MSEAMLAADEIAPVETERANREPHYRKDAMLMLSQAFPAELREDAAIVAQLLSPPVNNLVIDDIGPIVLSGEPIRIPMRIYFPEEILLHQSNLTDLQRCMLACIYTRHHNGLVREQQLGLLFGASKLWVIPFIIQLIGEYVIEIVELIGRNRAMLRSPQLSAFIEENPRFIDLTKRRATSYWNCYYRQQFPCKDDYPGLRLFRYLEASI